MQDLAALLRQCKERGISQVAISKGANVNQATVSRALRAKTTRHSDARIRLCNYAEMVLSGSLERKGPQRVTEAFVRIWDGTEAHAAAVEKVINSLEGLKPSTSQREEPA